MRDRRRYNKTCKLEFIYMKIIKLDWIRATAVKRLQNKDQKELNI